MKKGFTLIELLAVIVILAIIALIATPIVLSIIEDSKENSSLRSAEMYLDAVDYAIARSTLKGQNIASGTYNILENGNICLENYNKETKECKDSNSNNKIDILKVEVKGEKPKEGTIVITNGNVAKEDIVIKYENNVITYQDGNIATTQRNQTLCKSMEPVEQLLFMETPEIHMEEVVVGVQATEEAPYEPGAVYSCDFGDGARIFYVLKEEGNNIKLIMNDNFEDEVKWNESGNKADGPVTALAYLESETSSWDVLIKSGGKIELPSAELMREVIDEYDKENPGGYWEPNWVRTNLGQSQDDSMKHLFNAYWTSTPIPDDYDPPHVIPDAFVISFVAIVDSENGVKNGVRPLITVPKENIKVS